MCEEKGKGGVQGEGLCTVGGCQKRLIQGEGMGTRGRIVYRGRDHTKCNYRGRDCVQGEGLCTVEGTDQMLLQGEGLCTGEGYQQM